MVVSQFQSESMTEDLLHKVDVRHISEPVLQVLRDLVGKAVRSALSDKRLAQPVGALKSHEAAKYIGVSRARLYELLKVDPILQAASIKQGKSRLFLLEGLDQWLKAQQEPKVEAAAQRSEQVENVS